LILTGGGQDVGQLGKKLTDVAGEVTLRQLLVGRPLTTTLDDAVFDGKLDNFPHGRLEFIRVVDIVGAEHNKCDRRFDNPVFASQGVSPAWHWLGSAQIGARIEEALKPDLAARLSKGSDLFSVYTYKANAATVASALERARHKVSGSYSIVTS
jgi:hypothetical protein